MSNRAIITVQLGHYANHVGAHFWNMQVRIIYTARCSLVNFLNKKWLCAYAAVVVSALRRKYTYYGL